MIKKSLSPFVNPLVGPILVITVVLITTLAFYLPKLSFENKLLMMKEQSIRMIENLKKGRSYYTSNVISIVKEQSDIKINYDHKDVSNTIPLPATLLHELSQIIPENNVEMRMYSEYPFPNRKNRVLLNVEQNSLQYLINNPNEIFTQIETINGHKRLTVAVADVFYDPTCVNCHNNRIDTPKNDWQVGDVRGVIRVTMPVDDGFVLTGTQTINLLAIFSLLILILVIYYSFLSIRHKKEHKASKERLEHEVIRRTQSLANTNKLLNQYKKAVDSSAIVSKTNKKGVITFVNDEFIKLSQYKEEELLGKNHNIVRHPDMPKELFADIWKTIMNKEIWKGQIKNRAKDGSSYYVASTIIPILNLDDEIEEFLAIRLDITDIIKAQMKAQRADEAKSTFLANISHEIRTPLNAIIGFSDLLASQKNLDNNSQKQARVIQQSANALLEIINDILDISKIESGNFEIAYEDCDLYSVGENVIELFSRRAAEKNIQLLFNMDYSIPQFIRTDSIRLRQVLSNLVSNAIKFTPNRGRVAVNVLLTHQSDSTVGVLFEVKDSGIGIEQDKLENIFKPFIQVDSEANREFDGTGLGLSISQHIVEAMGSTIEVDSAVNIGTKFCFELQFELSTLKKEALKDQSLIFELINEEHELSTNIKNYLQQFGEVRSKPSKGDLTVYAFESNSKLEALRKTSSQGLLILCKDEDELEQLRLLEHEKAIALPFFASKINDAIQELIRKEQPKLTQTTNTTDQLAGRILVAEDNSANQELIHAILDGFGLEFVIKADGLEALRAYKKEEFDLVLMDINMPIMDGIEALNEIRQFEKIRHKSEVPIIALTANAIKGDREKFISLGMTDYLSKPINQNELKALLNEYINLERAKEVESLEVNETEIISCIVKRLGISESIAQKIYERFKEEISDDLNELKDHIQNNRIEQICQQAHYIKNSCLNIGLDEVCEKLQELEDEHLSVEDKHRYFNEISHIITAMIKG